MLMNTKKILPVKLLILTQNYKILMLKKYKFSRKRHLFKFLLQPIKLNSKRIKNYLMSALKVHII